MEELIKSLGSQKPYSVWDEYVPIITTGRHTDVYLNDNIDAPDIYGQLCHKLRSADAGDTFTLYINNGGGYVDTGFMVADAIVNTKAKVTAHLSGTVASISTIIALHCHKIIVSDHLSWLSHNYSGGIQGKGGEMKAQMDFMSDELAASFKSIHKGFFTDEEIKDIIKDNDAWLNSSEVRARLKARDDEDAEALAEIAAQRKTKRDK